MVSRCFSFRVGVERHATAGGWILEVLLQQVLRIVRRQHFVVKGEVAEKNVHGTSLCLVEAAGANAGDIAVITEWV